MHRLAVLLSAVVVMHSSALLLALPIAVAQEATPVAAAVMREVLVETTVPEEALPTGEDRILLIWQATIHPDMDFTLSAETVACCPGPLMDHVLEGELTVRVEGPLRVARVGTGATPGPVEEVAPGTEVVLRSGETALYDQASPIQYANRGTEPVQLASGGLFIGDPQPVPPPGYLINNFDAVSPVPPLPAGPVAFTLERVTLAPGAVLPAPLHGAVHVVTSGPQVAYLPEAADGSITNLLRESVVAYVLTLLPAGSRAGTADATPTA